MSTKAGKVQLKDLRAGKTIHVLGFEFFPAFRRVIPYLKAVHLDNDYLRTISKEQWVEILSENRVYKSRHAGERFMRLHGRDMLREENRWQMEVLKKVVRKAPGEEGSDEEVPLYSAEEVETWLDHCEELYDWQIETLALNLPMYVLTQGMQIKLRSYVKRQILTGSGRDVMKMTTIEDRTAQQVNQQVLEGAHEQPDAAAGQGV